MKAHLLSKKNLHILLAAAMSAGCLVLTSLIGYLYTDTDNYWIATVVNGLYSRDTYTIFLHPFLCRVLGLLARLLPTADVYTLMCRVLIGFGMAALIYLALEHGRSRLEKAVWLILPLVLTRILWLWSENFTVHAAFFAAIGFLCLTTDGGRRHPAYRVVGVLYICAGLMWRQQAAEILLPFALLVLLARFLGKKGARREYLLSLWKPLAALALCVAVLLAGQHFVDRSEIYLSDYAYNYGRSLVQDFPMRSWDEVRDELSPDVTKTEYDAVRLWILFDTENLNADKLERIGNAGAVDIAFDRHGIVDAAMDALRSVRWMGTGLLFLIALSLLLLTKLLFPGGACGISSRGSSPSAAALLLSCFSLIWGGRPSGSGKPSFSRS